MKKKLLDPSSFDVKLSKLKLLVPLDGSSMAESAIKVVTLLGMKYELDVLLLHVIESKPPSDIHGEPHLNNVNEAISYLTKTKEILQRSIEHTTQTNNNRSHSQSSQISFHVHESATANIAQSIADHSSEHQSDLIVICTHGGRLTKEVVYGSIAQKSLSFGNKPVLLIPQGAINIINSKKISDLTINNILVPVDCEHLHDEAIKAAVAIAKRFAAKIHFTSVVPTPNNVDGDCVYVRRFLPNTTKAFLDMSELDTKEHIASKHIASLKYFGIETKLAILRGDITKQLVSYIEKQNIDLLVATGHCNYGLLALFEGNLLQRLINCLERPMLLYHT